MSSDGGPHEWYSVAADPENGDNLIACGVMWNAKDNANYGFVYSSQDAGTSWHRAFEDKSTKDVSEESCAFGVHGVAYFVADAWSEDDMGDSLPDVGTTRIWVSRDSGRTWSFGTRTGWTDCSSSVVDKGPGPNQNRLYIFFNNIKTYYALGDTRTLERWKQMFVDEHGEETTGNTIGLISYKDGDSGVVGPVFNKEMHTQFPHGAFTHQNLMLKNGSLLTLFWAKRDAFDSTGKRKPTEYILAAEHSDETRDKLSDPVVVFRGPSGTICNSFGNAPAGYDSTTNTVYATYLDGIDGQCKLMLTKSTDNGQTWSPGHTWTERKDSEAKSEHTSTETYSSFALARNQEGVMALLWRNSETSNCWYFATSTDNGQTYLHPVQLSSCLSEKREKYQLSDAYLGFWDQEQAETLTDRSRIGFRNNYNYGNSHVSGIGVSPDGVFHPVWIASEHGEGQLRTAAIAVLKPRSNTAPELARTDGWQYKTNEVKFVYGGSQHYDEGKGVLTESVVVRNSGNETLKAPLRLELDTTSRLGRIYPLGVKTEVSGQNIEQYLDISQYISGDGLPPGASTASIPLSFHFELFDDAKQDDNALAQIYVRLLMREPK